MDEHKFGGVTTTFDLPKAKFQDFVLAELPSPTQTAQEQRDLTPVNPTFAGYTPEQLPDILIPYKQHLLHLRAVVHNMREIAAFVDQAERWLAHH